MGLRTLSHRTRPRLDDVLDRHATTTRKHQSDTHRSASLPPPPDIRTSKSLVGPLLSVRITLANELKAARVRRTRAHPSRARGQVAVGATRRKASGAHVRLSQLPDRGHHHDTPK